MSLFRAPDCLLNIVTARAVIRVLDSVAKCIEFVDGRGRRSSRRFCQTPVRWERDTLDSLFFLPLDTFDVFFSLMTWLQQRVERRVIPVQRCDDDGSHCDRMEVARRSNRSPVAIVTTAY